MDRGYLRQFRDRRLDHPRSTHRTQGPRRDHRPGGLNHIHTHPPHGPVCQRACSRLLGGLISGVVIVEATNRSRSKATVHAAEAIGAPVLAVPGPITSNVSPYPTRPSSQPPPASRRNTAPPRVGIAAGWWGVRAGDPC